MLSRVALSAVILGVPSVCAAPLIHVIQQPRSVTCEVLSFDPNAVTLVGPASGPWFAEAAFVQSPEIASSISHFSNAGDSTVEIFGVAEVSGRGGSFQLRGFAQSNYRLRFAVAQTLSFELTGGISAASIGTLTSFFHPGTRLDAASTVRLRRIAGPLVYEDGVMLFEGVGTEPFESLEMRSLGGSGVLPTGVYDLEVSASAALNAQFIACCADPLRGEVAFVVVLSVAAPPEPLPAEGDLDGDGDVDVADFARMQAAMTGPA